MNWTSLFGVAVAIPFIWAAAYKSEKSTDYALIAIALLLLAKI